MNTTSTEIDLLSAYIDGELLPSAVQEVEHRLETDPDFKALLQKLQRCEEDLVTAFHHMDKVPMPASLQNLLGSSTARQKNQRATGTLRDTIIAVWQKLFSEPAILAVTLLIPLMAILFLTRIDNPMEPVSELAMIDVNSAAVSGALDRIVAGESVHLESGVLIETLAFTRTDGVVCKNFQLRGKQAVNALSCFENGRWNNVVSEASTATSEENTEYYQLADGGIDSGVDEYIKSTIKAPLTVAEEHFFLEKLYKK